MAIVDGKRIELREGTLVLIQRGDTHEIRNTGRRRYGRLTFMCPLPTPKMAGAASRAGVRTSSHQEA